MAVAGFHYLILSTKRSLLLSFFFFFFFFFVCLFFFCFCFCFFVLFLFFFQYFVLFCFSEGIDFPITFIYKMQRLRSTFSFKMASYLKEVMVLATIESLIWLINARDDPNRWL